MGLDIFNHFIATKNNNRAKVIIIDTKTIAWKDCIQNELTTCMGHLTRRTQWCGGKTWNRTGLGIFEMGKQM